MKKYRMAFIGMVIALVSAFLGLASAMTPAPTGSDKAIVWLATIFFIVGFVLFCVGLVKGILKAVAKTRQPD